MARKKKKSKKNQSRQANRQGPQTPSSSTGTDSAVSPPIGSPAGFELTSFPQTSTTDPSPDQNIPLVPPVQNQPPPSQHVQFQQPPQQPVAEETTTSQPRASSLASAEAYRQATRPMSQGRFTSRLSEPNRRRLQAAHRLPDFEEMEEGTRRQHATAAPGGSAASDSGENSISRALTLGTGAIPYYGAYGGQHQQEQLGQLHQQPPQYQLTHYQQQQSQPQTPQIQMPMQQQQQGQSASNPSLSYVQFAPLDDSPAISALTPSSYTGPQLSDTFVPTDISSVESGGDTLQTSNTSLSILEGSRTFDEISIGSLGTAPSDEGTSFDNSSVQAPFSDQVKTLDALLTSPDRGFGPLGKTAASQLSPEEEDDYLDSELKDLEDSQRKLQRELASAEYRMLVETPEGGTQPRKKKSKKGSLKKQRLFHDDPTGDETRLPINEEENESDEDAEEEEDTKLPATGSDDSGDSSPRKWMQLLGFGRATTHPSVQGSNQQNVDSPPGYSSERAEAGVNSSADRTGGSLASSDSLFHSLGLFSDQISTPEKQGTPDSTIDPFGPSVISPETNASTPQGSAQLGPGPSPASTQSTGTSLRLLDEALETPSTPMMSQPATPPRPSQTNTDSLIRSTSPPPHEFQVFSSSGADPTDQRHIDLSRLSPGDLYSRPIQNSPQREIDEARVLGISALEYSSAADSKDASDDPPLALPGFSSSDSGGSKGSSVFEAEESSIDEEQIYFEYQIDPQKEGSSKGGSYEPVTPSYASTTTIRPSRMERSQRKISRICKFGIALIAVLAVAIGLGVGLGGSDGPGAGSSLLPDMGTGGGDQAPTDRPSVVPSSAPTESAAPSSSAQPSYLPTVTPMPSQSSRPSVHPSSIPSASPTITPTSSPSVSPTVKPSWSPTFAPLDDITLHLNYDILIKDGSTPKASYSQDLIDSMDGLASEIFLDLQATSIRRLRNGKGTAMLQLPTSIEKFEDIDCPVPDDSARCELVSASIVLQSGEEVWQDFKTLLEVAVAVGRLQYYLDRVNPNSPVSILDATVTDAPTNFPTSSPTPAPIAPTPSPTAPLVASPNPVPTSKPSKAAVLEPAPSSDLLEFLISISFDEGDALRNPASAQYKAYLWLAQNSNLDYYSDDEKIQRYVMATLYYSTNGDGWFSNEGWLDDENECYWFSKSGRRRVCSPSGRLVNLELDYNNLEGELPPELGLLSDRLERINLRGGPTKLIRGTIPTELGLLTKMDFFNIRGNAVTGEIPTELGNWLKVRHIDVSHNSLVGSLPTEFAMFESLSFLEVGTNILTGSLPTEIGLLTSCLMMHLENNLFEGGIPSEIGKLNKLQDFLAGNNLFSSFPSEMGRLTFADTISVYGNELRGTLPTDLGRLRRLRLLDLDNNAFTGTIPTEIGRLVDMRDRIDLSSNLFSGSIPSEIGRLEKLRNLFLQQNRLTGTVPNAMYRLKRLTAIRVDSNSIAGEIPEQVCESFNRTLPAFYSDCKELLDSCPCCTFCCVDDEGCECRYAGTDLEYLCFQKKSLA